MGPAARAVGRVGYLRLGGGVPAEAFASVHGELGVSAGVGAGAAGALGIGGLRAGNRGLGWEAGVVVLGPNLGVELLTVHRGDLVFTEPGVGVRVAPLDL
ncbi:MAG: hypothetical protein H6736_19285 [Alphaproteobacteria bacterium]|nr:hypothetical protein [Alphaproteobacteria bacterium]